MNAYNSRVVQIISTQYVDYLKGLISFNTKTSLMTKRIAEAPKYIQKLKTEQILLVCEYLDRFIKQILKLFESKEFCTKTRLFQNFIYMLFLDLIKIYNVFYIMITQILDRFKKMTLSDMEKALLIYKVFTTFTE